MPSLRRTSGLVVVALLLAACGGAGSRPPPEPAAASGAGGDATRAAGDAEAEGPPVPEALVAEALAASDAARAWMSEAAARPVEPTCELAPVYFTWLYAWDEESAEHRPSIELGLGPEALAVIDWDVRCMAVRGATSVELTGMVWALGSEEYAMALAGRLARGVGDALVGRGLSRSDVRTRSVGEEMATGQDALGWTRDVRVELR